MDVYEMLSNHAEADMSKIDAVRESLQSVLYSHFDNLSKEERDAIISADLLLVELWASKKTDLERFAEAMEEELSNS